jgi:hypothetical protein
MSWCRTFSKTCAAGSTHFRGQAAAAAVRLAGVPSLLYVFHRDGERMANWRDDWKRPASELMLPDCSFMTFGHCRPQHDARRNSGESRNADFKTQDQIYL